VRSDPQRFALVISDQTMPEMTGLALASLIAQIRPGLPIILMTGYSPSLTAERLASSGIRMVLNKPAPITEIAQAVYSTLHPSSHASLPTVPSDLP
jgi:DNA-binding NtrC family response regulator